MNIIVLGAGTFGTAIANELCVNTANSVLLYSTIQDKVNEINSHNTNRTYFPNKQLHQQLQATSDMNDVSDADMIFIALPSAVIIENLLILKPFFKENVLLVNLSKGLIEGGLTIIDSIQKELGINNIVTLKGPSFAVEVIEHADTLLTLGYTTSEQFDIVKEVLRDTALHVDSTTDIRGVELLSVLKNIYALVLGVVDAKYNSPNTRFMMLTKSFSEVRIILKLLGGSEDTLFLSCGFGDLCMTSLNDLSRNRTLGLLIGKGFFNSDYKSNSVILEGLNAIDMVYNLLDEKHKNDVLIFNKLYSYFSDQEKELEFKFDELIK